MTHQFSRVTRFSIIISHGNMALFANWIPIALGTAAALLVGLVLVKWETRASKQKGKPVIVWPKLRMR